MKKVDCLILAAGLGTRMKSELPKMLHTVGGQPLVKRAIDACRMIADGIPFVVVPPDSEAIRSVVGEQAIFVEQKERLGTGHAVMQAEALLRGRQQPVLVVNGDLPLLRGETLQALAGSHLAQTAPVTILVLVGDHPRGFGRIQREASGSIRAIIEEAHASPRELAIREYNAGVYCFDGDWLWENISQLPKSPKGEYYLTDMIGLAVSQGHAVGSLILEDEDEVIGINNRLHLAEAEVALRRRINRHWMLQGVTLQDPSSTYIGPFVTIGPDSVIYANTHLEGETVVGAGCRLGPNTIVRSSKIGDGCEIKSSVVEEAVLEEQVDIGPFAHLRRGAYLCRGVHMGNFGEVKNSRLGPGAKMGHFSYLGDAEVEAGVNIGAGTITCNYDGEKKHKTHIEEGAFIGSDTMLVAPVRIGKGARTGAGSVVTKDVPDGSVAVGVPARVIRRSKDKDD